MSRSDDIERIKAGADLHTTVSQAIVRSFGCGLTRAEITDIIMAAVCLLPLEEAEEDGEA